MKLRYKITLLICGVALSIATATTYWASNLLSDALLERFEDEGQFIAHSLSETLTIQVLEKEVGPVFDSLHKVVAASTQLDYIFITGFDGTLFAHSFSGGFPAALVPMLSTNGDEEQISRYNTPDGSVIHISQPLIRGMDARLHIGFNDNIIQTKITQLRYSLALIAISITVFAMAIGALLSHRVTEPLNQLTRAIQRFGRGELIDFDSARVKRGSEEVAELYQAFKTMVAAREESLKELRRSEASLAEAQHTAKLGNWDWNIQAGTLYWSDEIYRIFGLTPQAFDATYEAFLKSVHPEDHTRVTEAVNCAIASDDTPYDIDHRIVLPDGTIRVVHEQAQVFRDPAGGALRMLGTVQDITERKRVEDELAQHRFHLEELVEARTTSLKQREAELSTLTERLQASNQELEAFSYSVSHDLRAPLRAIDGFSLALQEDYGKQLDETGHDYLQRVRKGAQKMSTLIDDLLQLSRITRTELKPGPVDLSQLAEQAVEELRRGEPERDIQTTITPALQAHGDATLIGVLLGNLIGNAWKFTRQQPHAHIEVGHCYEGEQEVFFVRDNGAGFDMKYAHKLFKAFQRLHGLDQFEGTGIGLATVQRVINRHNGRIWTAAEAGKGATFFFTLSPG